MFSIPCLYRKYQSNENEAYAMAFIELFIDTVFYLTGFCESKKSFFTNLYLREQEVNSRNLQEFLPEEISTFKLFLLSKYEKVFLRTGDAIINTSYCIPWCTFGYQLPLKNSPPFFIKLPLKSANCPSSLF